MPGVNLLRRSASAAGRLTRRLIDDFPTTAVLLALRISLPVLKRTVGVKRLAAWLSARASRADTGETREERIRRAKDTIVNGGRLLISPNCLDRSLAAYWMLRRAGAPATLVLGAKHEHGALAGHAWVEIGDAPLDPSAREFTPIESFGGA
jgi:Transglutaminase-like superfamily